VSAGESAQKCRSLRGSCAGQPVDRRTKHMKHLHAPMGEVQRARKRTKRAKEAAQINSSKDRGEKQWVRYKTESVICLCLIATTASSSADASRARAPHLLPAFLHRPLGEHSTSSHTHVSLAF